MQFVVLVFPAQGTRTCAILNFKINSSAKCYKEFIERLRRQATKERPSSHNVPLLPDSPPSGPGNFPNVFDVILRPNVVDRSLRVRIQSHDLYIIGYRAEPIDPWYEFTNNSNTSLITSDTENHHFLRESGSYTILERQARITRENITLSQQAFNQAVLDLLDNNTDRRPRALLIIIQMISESMRLDYLLNHIVGNYQQGGFCPDETTRELENNWGAISGRLRARDLDPTIPIRPYIPERFAHLSAAALAGYFGLLLSQHYRRGGSGFALLGAVDMDTTTGQAVEPLKGRPLAQVFYVRILNLDNEAPGELYGTIKATDSFKYYYIYNRNKGDSEDVKPNGYATLTGPSRALSAADNFVIDIDLWDHDLTNPDDPISQGTFEWNAYDFKNVYDLLRTAVFTGKYGSSEMSYAVMSNAAEASVSVILINGDGESPADVYGHVWAQNTSLGGEIELYNKSSNKHENVYPNQPITLQRYTLAVPMTARLKIRVDLWDHDVYNPDDHIAEGLSEFTPDINNSASKFITSDYGKVEVRVEWL